MWKLLLALAILATPVPATAQESPAQAADPCGSAGACRMVGDVTLSLGGGKTRIARVGQMLPWIERDAILLFPGETIIVRLPEAGGKSMPLTLVATGEAAEQRDPGPGELLITFQSEAGNTGLLVWSGHRKGVRYRAAVLSPDGEAERSRVCPALPGLAMFKGWTKPVLQVVLSHFDSVGTEIISCR